MASYDDENDAANAPATSDPVASVGKQIQSPKPPPGVHFDSQHRKVWDYLCAALRNDDFGRAAIRAVGVVDLIPVNEEDHVGVLLDRAGLPQIGHDGSLIRAIFETAIKLRQGDDRHIELFRDLFECARYFRDLGSPHFGPTAVA